MYKHGCECRYSPHPRTFISQRGVTFKKEKKCFHYSRKLKKFPQECIFAYNVGS